MVPKYFSNFCFNWKLQTLYLANFKLYARPCRETRHFPWHQEHISASVICINMSLKRFHQDKICRMGMIFQQNGMINLLFNQYILRAYCMPGTGQDTVLSSCPQQRKFCRGSGRLSGRYQQLKYGMPCYIWITGHHIVVCLNAIFGMLDYL